MIQIVLLVELLYSLLTILTVKVVDVEKLILADEIIVISVKVMQDC
jgi:hypothetical protein